MSSISPGFLGRIGTNDIRILRGGQCRRERWWYKLMHVCRRWLLSDLILEFASHLGLSLLCTQRTPVADVLVYSPPLPLVIASSITSAIVGISLQRTMRVSNSHSDTTIACVASALRCSSLTAPSHTRQKGFVRIEFEDETSDSENDAHTVG